MHPVKERHWKIREAENLVVELLAKECSIQPLSARLLANRGICQPDTARRFLSSSLSDLHDPFLMLGMDMAVERLTSAIEKNELICIYGDYDVDGISSVALLVSFFRTIGVDCCYYIPRRLEEGYGLSSEGLKNVADTGATVIITVDCGVSAVVEAEFCATLGLDLIITDHHTPGPVLPNSLAVINPLQPGCRFPFKSLAGVGLAFNLMIALRSALRRKSYFLDRLEPNLREYLDLVALGTIADLVPLVDENRIFVKFGLKELSSSLRPGIVALKAVAGVTGEVGCGAVGFRLAPRLNAAGRLEDAALGVELLLCSDQIIASQMAAELDESNKERQNLEQEILRDALALVNDSPEFARRKSIVLASEGWHPGVVGIVASRVVEIYHRPTILIALQDGNGRGSGRSIPRFHLYDALRSCAEHLLKFGGHRQAVGLAIDETALETFTASFDEVASGILTDKDLIPELLLDAELVPEQISTDLATEVEALGPYGMGNPEPAFMLRRVEVVECRIVKGRHLKLRMRRGCCDMDAIGFNMADHSPLDGLFDVAFTIQTNAWNGRTSLQLRIKDIKRAI